MLQQLQIGQRIQCISRWETLFAYFIKNGIPSNVLYHHCIKSIEAEQIGRIIENMRPRTILEVGTFIGLSTGIIALSRAPGSTLVCVDPNLPVYDYKRGSLDFVRRMLADFGQEQRTILLEGFFSLISTGIRERIIGLGVDPEQGRIIGESVGMYAPFDLAFIDGDHYADAVYSDLSLLEPYMAHNGIIILHDVSGRWGEEVCSGIAQFIENHADFSLKTDNNLGFLSRDAKKSWLMRQSNPPMIYRVQRKIASLIGKQKKVR